jgi:hypothetical protein
LQLFCFKKFDPSGSLQEKRGILIKLFGNFEADEKQNKTDL